MIIKKFSVPVLAAVAVLLGGARANADPIVTSDVLTVFAPDNSIFHQATQAEDATESPTSLVIVPGVAVDASQFGNPTVLYELGGNPTTGPFSDIFGVAQLPSGAFVLAFQSDDETTGVFGGPATIKILETGPVDATMYLAKSLRDAGYTATFVSDVVPEPGSLALLFTGLASFGGMTWMKKRRTPAAA